MSTARKSLLPFLADTVVLGASLHGQAQTEMNQDACTRYKQARQALNKTCQGTLQDYAKITPSTRSPGGQSSAKLNAHRSPSASLTSKCAFPAIDKQAQYGTSYPARRCWVLSELSGRRTNELGAWANGISEGDVCRGGVKVAELSSSVWIQANRSPGFHHASVIR